MAKISVFEIPSMNKQFKKKKIPFTKETFDDALDNIKDIISNEDKNREAFACSGAGIYNDLFHLNRPSMTPAQWKKLIKTVFSVASPYGIEITVFCDFFSEKIEEQFSYGYGKINLDVLDCFYNNLFESGHIFNDDNEVHETFLLNIQNLPDDFRKRALYHLNRFEIPKSILEAIINRDLIFKEFNYRGYNNALKVNNELEAYFTKIGIEPGDIYYEETIDNVYNKETTP